MGVLRRALGAVLLVAFTQLAVLDARAAGAEVSFATPDEGIAYFTAALNQLDAEAARQAFALEGQLEGLNFVEMGKRLRVVNLMVGAAPERFEFYGDANRAKMIADAALQIRNLAYSLVAPPDTPLFEMIRFKKNDDLDVMLPEVEAALDPARLTSLKLLRSGLAKPSMANKDGYRKAIAAQLRASGGDEQQEWIALYDLDGATSMAGFTFVRYGDRWHIRGLTAPLAGTPSGGVATPVTEAEFLELLE